MGRTVSKSVKNGSRSLLDTEGRHRMESTEGMKEELILCSEAGVCSTSQNRGIRLCADIHVWSAPRRRYARGL